MTRQLSLRRSLAANAAGSSGDGSEGMMTRARRRRLCLLAEPSERERLADLGASEESSPAEARREVQVHYGPQEWRDWANLLPPDLVEEISGRLLSLDVAEYLRFRAVCGPWRGLTADPRTAGLLDSRFRPRNWTLLSMADDAEPHRRLINLATAASLGVHLPALSTHCHIGDADGLLLLFHKRTMAIRLLDPLTTAVTEFPAISSIVLAVPPYSHHCYSLPVLQNPVRFLPYAINGAGLDDSTSPPTLMLCLRAELSTIIFAKPGDAHWTLVSPGQVSSPDNNRHRKVLFCTLLSLGGRCYISSPEGSVYLLDLQQPLPRLVEVVDQRRFAEPADTIWCNHILSFLVGATGGRMLMVRYWRGMERFGGVGAYNKKELFTVRGITGRIEVLEVDIAGRRLVPVGSLGRYAVFVGYTHCLHISKEMFPSISADTIYLGCYHQQYCGFSTYHINKKNHRRTEPKHKFVYYATRFAPAARPYNLHEYLVLYVDRKHIFCKPCINHFTSCYIS
ncbi:unnamed protein product [Alopecurus aequalis]